MTVSWYSLYRLAKPITPLPTANDDFCLSLVVAVNTPCLGVSRLVDCLVEMPGPRQVIELPWSITKRAGACSFGLSYICRSLALRNGELIKWFLSLLEKGLPSVALFNFKAYVLGT